MTRDDIIKLAQESGLHSAVMLLDVTETSLTATEADQLEAIIDFAERVVKAENEALKAELAEQARLNGMGSEREARLRAVNAELVQALQSIAATFDDSWMEHSVERVMGDKARAALAKVEASK